MSTCGQETFCFAESAALHKRARSSLAMGVSSGLRRNIPPAPLFFERGDGPYFFDVDGHKLLDYTLGWGPLILGNNHPAINAAVRDQLSRGYTFGAQHRGEIELAELLAGLLPGVERVMFSNTGTEAIQAAIRLARAFTGRSKIMKFEGHYHGWLNNVLVSYRVKPSDACQPLSNCGGQPHAEFSETMVLPWNDVSALETAFHNFPQEIACVITEPLLVNGGGCLPSSGYLDALVQLCRQHGAVSIFDEVITGFRIALGGAREYFGVEPDLSVYAKALAGGFTLSAVGGRAAAFSTLDDGRTIHAGTYNGSPINLAAAIATINELSRPGVYDQMHRCGISIREAIEREATTNGLPLVTVGLGSVFSVHFGLAEAPRTYRDVLAVDAPRYERFRLALLNEGIYLLPDARWYIGAMHGETELEFTLQAIHRAMRQVSN